MSRPIDDNDLQNAMDLLRQEMQQLQDKALKLVDKKIGAMVTEKGASLLSDVMTSVDAKQLTMMKTIEAKFNTLEASIMGKCVIMTDKLGDRIDDTNKNMREFRQLFLSEVGFC